MSFGIDSAPTEDSMFDDKGIMSRNWVSWFNSLTAILNLYITQYRDNTTFRNTKTFNFPPMTTAIRDAFTNDLVPLGTTIYNTTVNRVQTLTAPSTWTNL